MLFETVTITDVKAKIGEWVKSMRKKQHLTQEELAVALNLSRLTIQNLESGKNTTIDTFLKVLHHFDSMDQFYHFVEEETKNNNHKSLY